jgi:hypothetical protein
MATARGSGTNPAFRPAPFFDHGLFLLHLNRGKEEMREGQHELARREFEEAQRLRPHDPEVLLNLSMTLFHLGLYSDAERMTRDLLGSHPDAVPLLFNLGLILFKSGNDAEAREPLEQVLALAPAHRKAHLTLGLILQRVGDTEEAQRHFRMAGAELKDGAEDDDSVSRTARAAAKQSAKDASARTQPTPTVKPEPLDSIGSGARPIPAVAKIRPVSSPGVWKFSKKAETGPVPGLAAPIGPFSPKPGGFLSAACQRGLRVRRGVIVGRSGLPDLEADGRLDPPLGQLLIAASGDGTLLLADQGRVPFLKMLSNEFLSVEPARLLAFEAALSYREDPAFEFRNRIATPFLKLFGTGAVALSVVAEPARFDVEKDQPFTIAARAVVAFGGDLTPELLEESDPIAALGAGPVVRFVGAGTVLADAR